MARPTITSAFVAFCALCGPVAAACPLPELQSQPPAALAPFSEPDPGARPALPACLENLAAPNQENCPRDEIAAYSAAIVAYSAGLQARVDASNDYANAAADHANAAIDHAEATRAHADALLEWAQCEIKAINAKIDE